MGARSSPNSQTPPTHSPKPQTKAKSRRCNKFRNFTPNQQLNQETATSGSVIPSPSTPEVVQDSNNPLPISQEPSAEGTNPLPDDVQDLSKDLTSTKNLLDMQLTDESLKHVRKDMENRDSAFALTDRGIVKTVTNQWGDPEEVLVLPQKLRREAFRAAHGTIIAGHLGQKYTLKKLAPFFYWPGMGQDVAQWCKECPECQRFNDVKGNKAPFHPLPVVRRTTEP